MGNNKNKVSVSVVMPIYNAENYIREALNSLINQTLHDFEVICVDDASTDNSYSILQEYARTDNRFVILRHRENRYAGVARNSGMYVAKGKYLCFLDADDFYCCDMLEKLYKKAEETDADIVSCNAYEYSEKNGKITKSDNYRRNRILKDIPEIFSYRMVPNDFFQLVSVQPWGKFFKREFIRANALEFQSTKRCNDEYFVNIAFICADKISFMDDFLLYHRTNNPNSLQGYGSGESTDFCEALKAIKSKLVERGDYQCIKNSFNNKVADTCLVALKRQKNINSFKQVYQCIKNDIFPALSIDEENIILLENNEIKDVFRMEPEEYLFECFSLVKESKKTEISFKKFEQAKRIVLYGAGTIGKRYFNEILESGFYDLVAWVDYNYTKFSGCYPPIFAPEKITDMEFDMVVIAIADKKTQEEVKQYLIGFGIEENRIVSGGFVFEQA